MNTPSLTLIHPITQLRTPIKAFLNQCEKDAANSLVYEQYVFNVYELFVERLSHYQLSETKHETAMQAFNVHFGFSKHEKDHLGHALTARADAALALYGEPH